MRILRDGGLGLVSFSLMVAFACGGDSDGTGETARSAGTERGPCLPDGTCDKGLICASNLCVELPPGFGGSAGSGGPDGSAGSAGSDGSAGSGGLADANGMDALPPDDGDASSPMDAGVADATSISCGPGTVRCGLRCVDTEVDSRNCGSCGRLCVYPDTCMSGTCVPLCFGGTSLCGTTCVDTNTDLMNCGSCDHACLGNETCIAGNCVSDTLAVGLLAYWRFDEGSGLVVLDSSGNGNHGALLTPSTSPTWTTGKVGGALNFDGVNDYVNVGVRPGLTVSQALTVIAWIRPSTYSTRNVNGGIIINNEGMYEISLSTAGIDYAVANTYPSWSGFWLRSGYLPPLNEWTHIAWSYSATNGQYVLYANGAVVDTQSGTGPIGDYLTSLNEFWIGARQEGWEQWFPGALDDIRIYNRALSLGEVQTLYDATR